MRFNDDYRGLFKPSKLIRQEQERCPKSPSGCLGLFPDFTVPAKASLRAARRVGARRLPWQSTAELFLRSSSRAARQPTPSLAARLFSRCPRLPRVSQSAAGMRGHGRPGARGRILGAQRHLLAGPGSGGVAGTAPARALAPPARPSRPRTAAAANAR